MTITLTREEAQQVLDAVSLAMSSHDVMLASDPPQDAWKARGVQTRLAGAWATLRARLAQPEPEPVAWHEPGAYGNVTVYKDWAKENGWLPLYKGKNE
jgi:hypothetical protein